MYLLHLELDGRLHLVDLAHHRLAVSQHSRELAGLVETGPDDTRNLLDERVGSKESIVLLGWKRLKTDRFEELNVIGERKTVQDDSEETYEARFTLTELLDQLLVLVQLFERLDIHARHFVGLSFVTVLLVSENAERHLGSRNVTQPENNQEKY